MSKAIFVGDQDRFCVSFDTLDQPGTVKAVEVILRSRTMRPGDSVNIALNSHPLYPELVRYVTANPYRPRS